MFSQYFCWLWNVHIPPTCLSCLYVCLFQVKSIAVVLLIGLLMMESNIFCTIFSRGVSAVQCNSPAHVDTRWEGDCLSSIWKDFVALYWYKLKLVWCAVNLVAKWGSFLCHGVCVRIVLCCFVLNTISICLSISPSWSYNLCSNVMAWQPHYQWQYSPWVTHTNSAFMSV